MAAIIAPMDWNAAASPLAELSTTSEVSGLGLRSVLTPQVADVWRLAPEALVEVVLPTDTAAGASKGGGTTRQGAVAGPPGAAGGTAYSNAAGSAFVRPGAYPVIGGCLYAVTVWLRRVASGSLAGSAIIAEYLGASGSVVRTSLPMASVPVDSSWRQVTLLWVPPVDGVATVYLMADTGVMQFELGPATLSRVAGQTRLDVNLGQDVACRLLLLAAPRDGVLPVAGSSWRAIGYSAAGGVVHDSGELPLEPAPRGRWPYVLPAAVVARRWRLVFRFGAGQPYAQFGRLYIGPAVVTSKATGYGLQRGASDLGSSQRSSGSGARYPARAVTLQQRSWRLPSLSAADAQALDDVGLEVGTTGQVFAAPSILNPARDGVLGVLRAALAPRHDNFIFWSADVSIEEDC